MSSNKNHDKNREQEFEKNKSDILHIANNNNLGQVKNYPTRKPS